MSRGFWLCSVAVLLLVTCTQYAEGVPTSVKQQKCKDPRVRKEWRALSIAERKSYIDAVLCLQSLPDLYNGTLPGALDFYGDLVAIHKIQTPLLLWEYETTLRDKCGYEGAQPYWDYTQDVAPKNVSTAPVFINADYGFGGNGEWVANETLPGDLPPGDGGGCIYNGPFVNYTIHIGRNTTLVREDRCLQRSINPTVANFWCTHEREVEIKNKTNYYDMWRTLEGGPSWEALAIHGGGHFTIGGSDADVFTSNTDPLFYLHHTNLDRIWWQWQEADVSNRLWQITGPIKPWSNVLDPDYSILPDGNVTLKIPLQIEPVPTPDYNDTNPKWTVGDVMDTIHGTGGMMCYEYV